MNNGYPRVVVTKRELNSLIHVYGLKNVFGPLKKLVKERGLVLNYVNKAGDVIGPDFKSYFDANGSLVHENMQPRERNA